MKIKNIAQYEETDSELAKYTICDLQNRINEAIKYLDSLTLQRVVYDTLKEILKGDKMNKEELLKLETITISFEEYKELLIIKGKYEELKSNQTPYYIPAVTTTPIDMTPKVTWSTYEKSENNE